LSNRERRKQQHLQRAQQLQQQQVAMGVQLTVQGQIAPATALPPAQQIEEYNRVIPGAGQALLTEFQLQSAHRRKMERIVVWSDAIRSFLGLGVGVLLGGYIVWTGGQLLREGHSIAGFSAIGTAVAIAVGPFLIRSYLQSKERQNQQQALANAARRQQR
jgi:uncharacterized membrane protein